jgi:hypothetical protein
VIGIKKKPDTGQKKTYYTTDNFFGVIIKQRIANKLMNQEEAQLI